MFLLSVIFLSSLVTVTIVRIGVFVKRALCLLSDGAEASRPGAQGMPGTAKR